MMMNSIFKTLLILLALVGANLIYAQNSMVKKAISYYQIYQMDKNLGDLTKAYEQIEEAYQADVNKEEPSTQLYYGIITKSYYDQANPKNKADLMILSAKALVDVVNNKSSRSEDKDMALNSLVYDGFDLYQEGINQYKEGSTLVAYNLYKELLTVESTLNANGKALEAKSVDGKMTKLSNTDILNNFVVFCLNSGKDDEALQMLKELIKENPTANGYGKLIQLSEKVNDTAQAIKYLEEGLNKFPDDQELLVFSINMKIAKKDHEGAIKDIDKAIAIKKRADLYLIKGQELDELKRREDAIKAYKEGLEIEPDNYNLNYNMGVSTFNEALKFRNEFPELADKYTPMIQEARAYFEKCKSLDPTKSSALDRIISQIDGIK